MTKFKSRITAAVLILILFLRVNYPMIVVAEEVTPTPEPTIEESITPTPTESPDQGESSNIDATSEENIDNNNNSLADTGNNTISDDCVSPTPIEDLSLSPEPDSALTPTPTPTPVPCPHNSSGSTIDTGDAVAVTTVENEANTTSVNSSLTEDNETVEGTQDSDIALGDSTPAPEASSLPSAEPSDLTVDNSATLNNDVVNIANTGGNVATGSAIIITGDAISVVMVINNIGLTLINSTLQILTLNIFGTLNGDIILPEPAQTSCDSCAQGTDQTINNLATVNNNVDSQAITGQNTIGGATIALIDTGQAFSMVSLINLVNSIFIGSNIKALFVNVYGEWNGEFLGWGDISGASGGTTLIFLNNSFADSLLGCGCATSSDVTNSTTVNNNVTSIANTGQNTINGGRRDSIITGDAYSQVSIINLINTTFINSSGVFAFVNIFGTLNGDIGGKSKFEPPVSQSQENQESQNSNNKEQGGNLQVTSGNNVGAYVYPGDTVTFSVKVKNTGAGKVYGTKVDLYLIRDGKITGGSTFDLGDIDAGRGKTLTTGFVLSNSIPGGVIVAQADAYGTVGPDDNEVLASSQNQFKVYLNGGYSDLTGDSGKLSTVLGTNNVKENIGGTNAAERFNMATLFALLVAYLAIRAIRRKEFIYAFINSNTFKERVYSFRMFLL